MSDESAATPDTSANPPAEGAPRARRISNPRPKKTAKPSPATDAGNESEVGVETPKASKFPEFPSSSENQDSQDAAPLRTDWPEPDAPSSGPTGPQETSKRKRRRKKGKGNQAQNPVPEADAPTAESEPSPQARQHSQQQRPQPQIQRSKLDPDQLARFAWKIYLSEVSEEGVALVGDVDAKELSRRCFRLAEIFLEEQARRR